MSSQNSELAFQLPEDPQDYLQSVVDRWESSETQPSVQELVVERPEIRRNRSLFVKLAYEEFRLRRKRGEELAPETFCNQFASCHYAVRRMLSVHLAMVEDHPSWLDEFSEGFLENDHVWPVPGQEFVRFRVLQEIGRGGLARVYLAQEHVIGNRLVVLKVSPRDTGEARIMGRLQHPGIMPIHQVDFDPSSGLHLVVMPFLGTTTLFDVLEGAFPHREGLVPATADFMRCLAEGGSGGRETAQLAGRSIFAEGDGSYLEAVVELGIQLAEALAYTHSRGVLHRDLKPSNILITPQGLPLLMDFNLSARTDGPGLLAGGTIPYMPPELLSALSGVGSFRVTTTDEPFGSTWNTVSQEDCVTNDLRGDSTNREFGGWIACADPRSDLFSWGVILYELLTGQLPFGEPDLRQPVNWQAEWVLKRQFDRRVERHAGNLHIPEGLFELLQRCMAVESPERPGSAEELACELRAWRTTNLRRSMGAAASQETLAEGDLDATLVSVPDSDTNLGRETSTDSSTAVPANSPSRRRRTRLQVATLAVSAVSVALALIVVTQSPRSSKTVQVSVPDAGSSAAAASAVPDEPAPVSDAQAMMQRAMTQIGDARWDEALVTLQNAIKVGAPAGENYSLQAFCLLQTDRFPSAAGKCEAAVQNDYGSAAVLNNWGYALVKNQRYKRARQVLEAALALAPNDPVIHHNMADLEFGEGQLEPAVKHARFALENTPEPSVALRWLAASIFAEASSGDDDLQRDAVLHLEAAVRGGLNPNLLDATSEPLGRVVQVVRAKDVRPLWPNNASPPNDRILWPAPPPAAEPIAAVTGK